jgi:maltose O-acetyltransferase
VTSNPAGAGSERDKMLRGELYRGADPELTAARQHARDLWQRFNAAPSADVGQRAQILTELIGSMGEGVTIEPPFYCDYGSQIELAEGVFVNLNCVFLDAAPIRIGAHTLLGPNVQLYTADHPRDPHQRITGPELAAPITIGSRVWIGGGSVICPGITIGDDTTIGAGSVVVHDIPRRVIAAGNPCQVRRSL